MPKFLNCGVGFFQWTRRRERLGGFVGGTQVFEKDISG